MKTSTYLFADGRFEDCEMKMQKAHKIDAASRNK